MQFHDCLDMCFRRPSNVRILRALCNHGVETTGRELARLARMSHWVCHRSLAQLCMQGLVRRRTAGRAHLFSINRDNPAITQVLAPAFTSEQTLLNDFMRDILKECPHKIVSAAVFGSVARKAEKPGSDLDLLVIVPDAAAKKAVTDWLIDRSAVVAARLGGMLSPYVVTVAEFRNRFAHGDRLIVRIFREAGHVSGARLVEIIGNGGKKHPASKR